MYYRKALLLFLTFTLFSTTWICGQVQPATNGLTAYFPMNEGTSTSLTDASGNGHTGNLVNSPLWSLSGRIDKCVEMVDNSGRYISVPSLTWAPASFTVSWWMNPYSYNQNNQLIGAYNGWGAFLFHTANNGSVSVGTDVHTRFVLGSGTVKLNEWQHFIFSYSSGAGKFYRNGQLLSSRTNMTAPLAWGGFFIGGTDPTSSMHGKIDELRFYNRALTDEEVATLAAWPLGPAFSAWKSTPSDSEWKNGANWIGGYAPINTSEVVIGACTICPAINSDITVAKLTLNAGSSLHINAFRLFANSIKLVQASIYSDGGVIQSPKVEDINTCQFYKEPSSIKGGLTIDVSPEGNAYTYGGNIYYTPITYQWGSGSWSNFSIIHQAPDIFKEQATFINNTPSWMKINAGPVSTVFEKKAEFTNRYGRTISLPERGSIQFNDTVVFNNHAWDIGIAHNAGSSAIFHKPVVVNGINSNVGFANGGNVTFHSSVLLSHSANHYTQGISFGGSGGITTLTENASLKLQSGFSSRLTLIGFIQTNENTPTVLYLLKVNFTDPPITLGPNSSFKGDVHITAPNILLNGGTFYKKAVFEKIGGNMYYSPNSLGGNTFHGETHIINKGGSYMFLGQNAIDKFNGDLYVTHAGANGTYLAHWNSGHQFNGHLSFTTTPGTQGGIVVGEGGGSAMLAENKTLSLAGVGSGLVRLYGFTQKGIVPFSLLMPAGTGALTLGNRTLFEGELRLEAPHLYLNGATFNKQSTFIKTAAGNNVSIGGNTFKGKVYIVNKASTGTLNLASQYADLIQYQ